MILYVNGDSHTAAAEAVNAHAFAEDDPNLGYLHRLPHPDNLAVVGGDYCLKRSKPHSTVMRNQRPAMTASCVPHKVGLTNTSVIGPGH